MAPLVTHVVVGERVFAQMWGTGRAPGVLGAFLQGCVLVDVHMCGDVDRRATHFVGRLEEDGADAFEQSCARFLARMGTSLPCPWDELGEPGQSFVAGYACHLAADEAWKAFGWKLMQALGVRSWRELPVPAGVLSTVCAVLSHSMLQDPAGVASAARGAVVPDVLRHVPYEALHGMWELVLPLVVDGGTPQDFFRFLARLGKAEAELGAVRLRHARYWDQALAMVRDAGGVERPVEDAVRRSVQVLPRLWG